MYLHSGTFRTFFRVPSRATHQHTHQQTHTTHQTPPRTKHTHHTARTHHHHNTHIAYTTHTNAWTRARRATDRDLESFNVVRKENGWTCAPRSTDHDPALDKNLDHLCNFMRTLCFLEFISSATLFLCFFDLQKMFWNCLTTYICNHYSHGPSSVCACVLCVSPCQCVRHMSTTYVYMHVSFVCVS